MLCDLHWLPIKFRIDFKVVLLTFKCLNNLAPDYLTDLLSLYTPSYSLRSSGQLLLAQPRHRLKTRGDRAFASVAPNLWNSLPATVRPSDSIQSFKARLKTYLFDLAFPTH